MFRLGLLIDGLVRLVWHRGHQSELATLNREIAEDVTGVGK